MPTLHTSLRGFLSQNLGVGICSTWDLEILGGKKDGGSKTVTVFEGEGLSGVFGEVRIEKRNCRPTAASELPGS